MVHLLWDYKMRKISLFILLIYMISSGFHSGKNPHAEISNGILKASIYLPDAKNGYYRATRFDWSGIISSLEYKGHNYFGKWFEDYDPTFHGSIMGSVDSFDPLNYDETKSGAFFVTVGVGRLTKISNKPYKAFTTYPIIDTGTWEIKREAAKIQFHQVLKDKDYPYEYTKTVEFIEGKPKMVLSYTLKNKGKHTIETQVFNHNFFVFDNQPLSADIELTFAKNVSGTGKGFGDIAELRENKLKIKRYLAKDESVYCASLKGINNNANDYNIKIDNHKTGAGVRIKGNQPISNLVFWCNAKTICPEPYIKIKIKPGEEFSWENSYEFYINDVPVE
jgi:hypothetical protein